MSGTLRITCPRTRYPCDDTGCLSGARCRFDKPYEATPRTGWLCPACGRGNSPDVMTCSCTPAPPVQVTCAAERSAEAVFFGYAPMSNDELVRTS